MSEVMAARKGLRARRVTRRPASVLAGLTALALACLPSDTRRAPGRALARLDTRTVAPELTTADGWTLGFERVLVSFGELELDGADCAPYSESDYLRIIDVLRPESQPLATLHALGTCSVAFRLEAPDEDAVLGAGVSEADRAFLRSPASDALVEQRGIALYVRGSARRGQSALEFEWSFRRDLAYERCGVLVLGSDQAVTVDIAVRIDSLFRGGDAGELEFEAFAAAEADGDGQLSFDELDRAASLETEFSTLLEQLYVGRVPRVPRWPDTPPCAGSDVGGD